MVACVLERYWPAYVGASFVSLIGGVLILLLIRLIHFISSLFAPSSKHGEMRGSQRVFSLLQMNAEAVLYGSTLTSNIIVITFWIIDIASSVVYIVEASSLAHGLALRYVERDDCGTVATPAQILWIIFMCFSIIRFTLRFFAAKNKIRMWIELDSVIDHFTIVPTFVGIHFDRDWLGFRFLRVYHLVRLPELLQLINLVQSRFWIRILYCMLFQLWAMSVGSSLYFMAENTGDPWYDYKNNITLSYWNCHYMVLAITSTGFGGYYPATDIGKIFLFFYMIFVLVTYARLIPELVQLFHDRWKFKVPYKVKASRGHIVVTGNISYQAITSLVKILIGLKPRNPDVVIISREQPSAKMQVFFRRYYSNVTFIEGTVMNTSSLKRAKIERALAVLILANSKVENQDHEDFANIMRATAVKNYLTDVRIIIELLQHRNKEQLLHLPSWSWRSDEVICISELRMGLMAKSCLAPGFATLLSNLITRTPYKSYVKSKEAHTWINDYCSGADQNVYVEKFSDSFVGMTFTDAAELCYKQFGVVLLAILGHGKLKGRDEPLIVNPAKMVCIRPRQRGFFIARNEAHVHSIARYSAINSVDPSAESTEISVLPSSIAVNSTADELSGGEINYAFESHSKQNRIIKQTTDIDFVEAFDQSGTVHWCPAAVMKDALLDASKIGNVPLVGHIICDLNADGLSSRFGLRDFMLPLRSSSIPAAELTTVVFYTSLQVIETVWESIAHFPRVLVFIKSGSLHVDLKALNIRKCSMCLVWDTSGVRSIDDVLVDTNAIQTTLQITSFCKVTKQLKRISRVHMGIEREQEKLSTEDVQLLCVLEYDGSVSYIDDDYDDDPSYPVSMALPFASGRVLVASVFDALVAIAFLDSDVIRLYRTLITGIEVSDFEAVLMGDLSVSKKGADVHGVTANRRSNLSVISLSQPPMNHIQHRNEYGALFVECLRCHGILCLGLYRLLQSYVINDNYTFQQSFKSIQQTKRFVITNPRSDFRLLPTDQVYALKPFSNADAEA